VVGVVAVPLPAEEGGTGGWLALLALASASSFCHEPAGSLYETTSSSFGSAPYA
ncbi:hypothetical protein Dimus_006680, partial [Dionaea muscipula]